MKASNDDEIAHASAYNVNGESFGIVLSSLEQLLDELIVQVNDYLRAYLPVCKHTSQQHSHFDPPISSVDGLNQTTHFNVIIQSILAG